MCKLSYYIFIFGCFTTAILCLDPPDDKFRIEPNEYKMVLEGSKLNITCIVEKQMAKLKIMHKNKEVSYVNIVENDILSKIDVIIDNVDSSKAGEYICQSDRFSATRKLKIEVGTVDVTNGIWNGERKQETNITCQESGIKDASLQFMRNGEPVEMTKNVQFDEEKRMLSITTLSDHYIGEFVCRFTFKVPNPITKQEDFVEKSVYIESPPYISPDKESKNLVEDEKLIQRCVVFGYPSPTVNWSRQVGEDKTFQPLETDDRISFKDDEEMNVQNAYLVIKNIKDSDRAKYRCFAANNHGNYTREFLLRVKEKYAALWPFLGIVIEVILVCIIIFVYEKNRKKPADPDENGPLDKKSNADDKSDSCRQRAVKT